MKWSRLAVSDSLQPVDCSPPSSSVHGILQARILEWVAISFSRESSRHRDRTQVSHIASRRPGIICLCAINFFQCLITKCSLHIRHWGYQDNLWPPRAQSRGHCPDASLLISGNCWAQSIDTVQIFGGKAPNLKYLNKDPQYLIWNPWCQMCFRI